MDRGRTSVAIVRFAYNEDTNVIVTVTGSASHMRGPEFFRYMQLLPRYRPIGMSRIQACTATVTGCENGEFKVAVANTA